MMVDKSVNRFVCVNIQTNEKINKNKNKNKIK